MEIIESISWFGIGFVPTLILLHIGAKSYGMRKSRTGSVLAREVAA